MPGFRHCGWAARQKGEEILHRRDLRLSGDHITEGGVDWAASTASDQIVTQAVHGPPQSPAGLPRRMLFCTTVYAPAARPPP